MIQWMHQLSKTFVATLLSGMLALSFVLWGIGDIFTGATSTAVATVGGTNIESAAFTREYRNFLRSQGEQMGLELTPDMAQRMGLGQTQLQQTIDRTAIDNYVAKKGIVSSDGQVTEAVHAMNEFRGPNGQFNYQQFVLLMQSNGLSEADFTEQMRSDLARRQLLGSANGFFILPGEYSLALYLYLSEKRAADYVMVTPAAAGEIAPPDDKALNAFIKENAARFSTPEYRDVQFAWAVPADVKVEVTDKMIADEYAAKKSTYNVAEKRELSQLEFKTEAEARAARAKIDAGTSFEQLASQRGLKPADITLGTKTAEELGDAAAAKAAFAVGEGQVSEPVKGTFGWVMLKTGKITPGVSRPLDSVKEEIRTSLQTQLAADKLVDVLNAYDDARKNGETLAVAAKKANMHYGHVAAMDSKGLTPEGKPAEVPSDPEFLTAAFKADAGADNDPVSAKSGAYYVVRVNGTTPPKLKPLDQVRADATAQWLTRERANVLAVKAKALADQAVKEKSLAGIAATLKAGVQKSPALQRDTNTPAMPAALVAKLFEARPSGIVYAPQGDGYVIAQVTGIAHARPQPGDREYPGAAQQIAMGVAGDFTSAMVTAARNDQKVKINQKNLDAVIGGPQ